VWTVCWVKKDSYFPAEENLGVHLKIQIENFSQNELLINLGMTEKNIPKKSCRKKFELQ